MRDAGDVVPGPLQLCPVCLLLSGTIAGKQKVSREIPTPGIKEVPDVATGRREVQSPIVSR